MSPHNAKCSRTRSATRASVEYGRGFLRKVALGSKYAYCFVFCFGFLLRILPVFRSVFVQQTSSEAVPCRKEWKCS
jgi:hypothetical protein